jgi:large subunit ribosomal protein L18
MINKPSRKSKREFRQSRVRKNVFGTPERPRLVVFRSLSHIYAQIIDDLAGTTLVAASTLDESLKGVKLPFKERAHKVGELVGKKAQEQGVSAVVFDRGGYKYHGRIAALAEGARSSGLDF